MQALIIPAIIVTLGVLFVYFFVFALARWVVGVRLLAAALLLLSQGCGRYTLADPNLSQQIQAASVGMLPPMVFSDTMVWIIIGENTEQWVGNNEISKIFSYTAQVSLAALTIAVLKSGGGPHTPGLLVGQSVWMALLKIFQPNEFAAVYAQGMIRLNSAMSEYLMCMAAAGSNTVPRDTFTPCGAVLYQRTTSAINLVTAMRVQLMPLAADLQNTEPPKVELPQTMKLPQRAVAAPKASVP